ncbi:MULTISPECIES: Lin0512 family protein [unclassified Roseovarius]|uniref:Lin0512 family protein n=1 Tax=unclassified Roseovarius TaxID=2614913 RepID=UPI00273F9300|nr:Lin0512 family protein [Roseovarius sp. MMSF_3350]
MPKTRLLTEFGIGSSLRHRDYTAAARRALQDALWRNSINLAELFGQPKEAMIIDVEIAAPDPDAVDIAALADVFPYGKVSITAHMGGLDVPRPDGGTPTVIVNAAINVSLNLEPVQ